MISDFKIAILDEIPKSQNQIDQSFLWKKFTGSVVLPFVL